MIVFIFPVLRINTICVSRTSNQFEKKNNQNKFLVCLNPSKSIFITLLRTYL
jgi:hypothetical protein